MLVRLPRFARNHARTSGTHVFRHSLLRCGMNIQSGQIDGYMHWRPIFSSARFASHGTPHSFLDWVFNWTLRWVQRLANHTLLTPVTVKKFLPAIQLIRQLSVYPFRLSGNATAPSHDRTCNASSDHFPIHKPFIFC
jgi:hypothetical protein